MKKVEGVAASLDAESNTIVILTDGEADDLAAGLGLADTEDYEVLEKLLQEQVQAVRAGGIAKYIVLQIVKGEKEPEADEPEEDEVDEEDKRATAPRPATRGPVRGRR